MSRLIYNVLLFLCSPLLVLYFVWRLASKKEDGRYLAERWGFFPKLAKNNPTPRIWVHAVSVGEVMAARPILRELRRRHPEAFLLLTTTTLGGREVARSVTEASQIAYFPLDFLLCARYALKTIQPDLILLMEWEIWPNFLNNAKQLGAYVAVLNGRISDRGLRRGQKARFFTQPGLAAVDVFLMQSDEDARRAECVGVASEKVIVVGNTKFDETATVLSTGDRAALRAELGISASAPVWVCGSTRDAKESVPDEEVLIAEAARIVRQRFPDLVLIVAPRHLTRAEAAAAALGGSVARRSRGEVGQTLLLDTFGELARIYAIADVAFVGGSLAPWGGQSVFQPLAQGCVALFGPSMNNQRDIAQLAIRAGVGFQIRDPATLAETIIRLLSLPLDQKAALSESAIELIARNQGVAKKCVDLVEALVDYR
jgi:3-deoxy-D-manno-octulosonic-acid transferase